jgi:hypothetical protein
MPRFRVSWEIDIEAGDPVLAAKQALAIQRDPESTATQFGVKMQGPCEKCHQHLVHKPSCKEPLRLCNAAGIQPNGITNCVDYTFPVEATCPTT